MTPELVPFGLKCFARKMVNGFIYKSAVLIPEELGFYSEVILRLTVSSTWDKFCRVLRRSACRHIRRSGDHSWRNHSGMRLAKLPEVSSYVLQWWTIELTPLSMCDNALFDGAV